VPPLVVESINADVNHDHQYSHYIRKMTEGRVLNLGEPGNCTDIAFSKKQALAKGGIHSIMFACNLKGTPSFCWTTRSSASLIVTDKVSNNRRDVRVFDIGDLLLAQKAQGRRLSMTRYYIAQISIEGFQLRLERPSPICTNPDAPMRAVGLKPPAVPAYP
jgi:hypothetical protein